MNMPNQCQNCGGPKPLVDVGLHEGHDFYVCLVCRPTFTAEGFSGAEGFLDGGVLAGYRSSGFHPRTHPVDREPAARSEVAKPLITLITELTDARIEREYLLKPIHNWYAVTIPRMTLGPTHEDSRVEYPPLPPELEIIRESLRQNKLRIGALVAEIQSRGGAR